MATEEERNTISAAIQEAFSSHQKAMEFIANKNVVPAAVVTMIVGLNVDEGSTFMNPIVDMPVKGREHVKGFLAAACISRDAILTLIALNKQFDLGITEALELMAMTHPMVAKALRDGHMTLSMPDPDPERAKGGGRVVRDFVEVGAGAQIGGESDEPRRPN